MPKPYIKHIEKIMTEQVTELLLELEEREYDLSYTNVIFVGGGAIAVKNYSDYKDNIAYDCDILANAKGYEFLAEQMFAGSYTFICSYGILWFEINDI